MRLFSNGVIVLLTIQTSFAKLLVEGGCDTIGFQLPLFSSKHETTSHGNVADESTPISGTGVLIVPSYKDYKGEPLSVLIYHQRDSEFITNLPKDITNVDSWPDSFGICTADDIILGKCQNTGEFTIEVNNEIVEERTVNKPFKVEKNGKGWLNPVVIELNNAKYCYVVAIDRPETKSQDKNKDKEDKRDNSIRLIFVHPINTNAENTIGYIEYYGSMLASIVELFLGVVLWVKIRSDNPNSDLATPYKACFSIVLISFIASIIQMLNTRQYINPINSATIESSFYFKHSKFFRIASSISETASDIVIYLVCFQFLNLDRFGIKVNFRKNRYGYLFIGVLIWTLTVHPFIINNRYEMLSAIQEKIHSNYNENQSQISRSTSMILQIAIREFVGIFNLLNFLTIWFLLYKTSQYSETKFLYDNTKNKEYLRKFKSTRIWLIFSSIVIKIVGLILGRYIYQLDWNLIQYVESHIEESYYKQVLLDVVLSNVILFVLKALLILLKSANMIVLPILVAITLRIWWSYDEVRLKDDIEMEDGVQ